MCTLNALVPYGLRPRSALGLSSLLETGLGEAEMVVRWRGDLERDEDFVEYVPGPRAGLGEVEL